MPHPLKRIFALDPTTQGFGYAIFEPPLRLVTWGFADISGDKQHGAIARFKELLDHSEPDAVILEDAAAPGSRRRPRVRELITALAALARERGIAVYQIARTAILRCFEPDGRITKHAIATMLSEAFPELKAKLPPPRKPWKSEAERMAIFDAVALAVTHLST